MTKRHAISILAAAVWLAAQHPAAGQYVEIGTGTSAGNYVPLHGYWDYGWSQVIYLQSDIGGAMDIGGISYHVNNTPANYATLNQRIYLKHTSLTAFANANYDDPDAAGFTKVFDGDLTWNGAGWHEITFDTPFAYNGSDNLIVYWQNGDDSYASGYPKFRYTAQSNRAKYKYADNSFPAVSGSRSTHAANIRLHAVPSGPGVPTVPHPSDNSWHVALDASPTLTWTNPAAATYNAVYFSETESDVVNTSETARVLFDGTTLYDTYLHSQALDLGTIYYWRVLEYDSEDVTSGPVWNFSTIAGTVTNFPWSEDFEHGGFLPRFWTQEVAVATNDWIARTGGDWGNPATAHDGTYNAVLIGDKVNWGASQTRLITPPLDLSASDAQLSFWHAQVPWEGSQDELRIFYRTASDGEWALIPGAEFTIATSSWTKRIVNLPNPSAHYQIAFHGYNNFGYGICIDDVEVAFTDYPGPTNPRAESITQTGAVLRWDGGSATSWSVEWGLAGFTPGAGSLETGLIDEELSLAGLTQGTQYEFYVRNHYPEGDSNWNGPVLFTTAFEPITVYPWTESFESVVLPPGWTEEFVEYDESWFFFENDGIDEDMPEAYDGSRYAVFGGAEEVTKLVTRELDLSGMTSPQLSFWHAQRAWDDDQDELRVYYRQGTNGTWTLIPGAVYTEEVFNWTQRIFTLPTPSASYFIAFEGTGNYGYGTCIDLVRIEDTAYAMPSELTVDALYSSSADISWNGSALSYDVEWGTTDFGVGSGTRVTGVATTAYSITGLDDNTEYDVFVRTVYADGVSGWAGPETFDTFWGAVNAFPWLEDFERGYSVWDQWDFEFVVNDHYWLLADGGASDGETNLPTAAFSGTRNAIFAPSETGSVTRLISRELDLRGLTHPELTFQHAQYDYLGDHDTLSVFYRVGDEGEWKPLPDAVFDRETPRWQPRFLALPEPGGSYFIGFFGTYNWGYGVCLDDVMVYDAACPIPTNLTVSAVSGNSADFAWGGTADHWNVEWGDEGFVPGTGTRANGVETPTHTLAGLSGWTTYDAYVQSVCGVSTSAWAGPITFETGAGKITSFPWMDDFEPWQQVFERWTNEFITGNEPWDPHNGSAIINENQYPQDAYSGVSNMLMAGEPGNVSRLVSPEFDLSGMTWPRLRFQHAQRVYDLYNYQDELRVYYRIGTEGVWTLIEHGTYTANVPNWTEQTLYLPNPSDSYFIAFVGTAGWGYGVCVDDVILDDGPVPPPLNLRAKNVAHDAADLLWDGAGAALWNLEWGQQGFTPGAGTLVSGIETNFYTLTGLAENTTYDFYVQEDRGTEQSAWEGPASFTSPFAPIAVFPWLESFEHGGALPDGWQNIGDSRHGQVWHFDIPGGAGSDPVRYAADADHTSGSGYVAWLNDSYTFLQEPTITLVSRELDLTGLDYPMLSFRYWIGYGSGSQWPSSLEVDVFDGTQWHSGLRVVSQNMAWSESTLDLTPYKSAVTRVRFRGKPRLEGTQSDVALDDVGVMNWTAAPGSATPLFPSPGATGVPVRDALQWSPAAHASGYKLWLGTDNPPSTLIDGEDLGDATSRSFGMLDFGTTYYWKVVPYNAGGGDAAECPVWSFTTQAPAALPWFSDFDSDDGGFVARGAGCEWEHGKPVVFLHNGLSEGYDGSDACWGVDLDNYANGGGAEHELYSPWFDLTGADKPELSFWHIASANYQHNYPYGKEKCIVQISVNGVDWTTLPSESYRGDALQYAQDRFFYLCSYAYWRNQDNSGSWPQNDWWRRERFALDAWKGQVVQLRFVMDNSGHSSYGWYLDNLRVDEAQWRIRVTSGDHGQVQPAGDAWLYDGTNAVFTFAPDAYHHVAGILTNGSPAVVTTPFSWSNIRADGTLHATFAPTLAVGGTPHHWLAEHDLIDGGAYTFDQAEQRVMGPHNFTAGEEYIADTDPNDPEDYFRITAVSNLPPWTLYFKSSPNRIYTLLGHTNLMDGAWQPVPGAGPQQGSGGAATLSDNNEPPKGPFYRLQVELMESP